MQCGCIPISAEPHRDTMAANRLLTRLLRKQGCRPKRMVTDKLRSYGAAKLTVMPDVEHRSHKS
jgi:putative transposase